MLVLHVDDFTMEGIAAEAEHFYGRAYGDVIVRQHRDLELINGAILTASTYCYSWSGSQLRPVNDLELYRFRSALEA